MADTTYIMEATESPSTSYGRSTAARDDDCHLTLAAPIALIVAE